MFREKYSAAWQQFRNLNSLRQGIDTPVDQVTTVLDGNVVLMSAPSTVCTLNQYVAFFRQQIDFALEASTHVIVVFDEPEHLTKAKQAEQMKRDASRQKREVLTSEDLCPIAKDDNWSKADLCPEDSIRLLFGYRAARQRAIDLICCETLKKLDSELCKRRTATRKTVTFDGVDWRGGERSIGLARVPGVVGTDDRVVEVIEREIPIGEGDLKLTDVSLKVELGRLDNTSPFCGTEVVFICTIDTDSILIELASQARRVEEGIVKFSVFLCLKERAAKREIGEGHQHSYYNVADLEVLGEEVLEDLFGRPYGDVSIALRRKGTALLTLGLASCGTDFCGLKGARARDMMDILRSVCSDEPFVLSTMEVLWRGNEADLMKLDSVLRYLIRRSASLVMQQPRRKKAAESLNQVMDEEILKVLWTVRYWLGQEIKDVSGWGFRTDHLTN